MSMYVQGVCVGKKQEVRSFKDKNGDDKEWEVNTASFASVDGVGIPVDIDMTPEQMANFRPYVEQYRFPVEARAFPTRNGPMCRISILEGGRIERQPNTPPGSPGSQVNAGTPANPGK